MFQGGKPFGRWQCSSTDAIKWDSNISFTCPSWFIELKCLPSPPSSSSAPPRGRFGGALDGLNDSGADVVAIVV